MSFIGLLSACLYLADWVDDSEPPRIGTSSFGVSNAILDKRVIPSPISASSRALTHYDPRIIREVTGRVAFNIGLNGSQPDMQLARLQAYLEHNQKPALLIHNLDLFSLQVTHGGVYDPGQYLAYQHEPALYQALRRINPNILKARLLPLYG